MPTLFWDQVYSSLLSSDSIFKKYFMYNKPTANTYMCPLLSRFAIESVTLNLGKIIYTTKHLPRNHGKDLLMTHQQ